MLKKISIRAVAICVVAVLMLGLFSGCRENTLKVYNWAEYIGKDVLKQFTEETGIKVKYSTFDENETMYTKVKNSGGYDVVVPSDYMVQQMIEEDMLEKLDFNNIPNFSNVDEFFVNPQYDPENEYSVPYLWGAVAILYNIEKTGGVIDSMQELFNPKYKGQIFMLDSIRDTIGMTLKMLGYSMNDTDPAHINEAKQKLLEQKELVLAYGTDEIRDKMIAGEGALALVYIGEGIKACEGNDKLRVVIPKEGTNIAIDNFVVMKGTQMKAEAEAFINFMCRPDIAVKNAMETGYATVNASAKKLLPTDISNDIRRYPNDEIMAQSETFVNIPDAISLYTSAWEEIKAK